MREDHKREFCICVSVLWSKTVTWITLPLKREEEFWEIQHEHRCSELKNIALSVEKWQHTPVTSTLYSQFVPREFAQSKDYYHLACKKSWPLNGRLILTSLHAPWSLDDAYSWTWLDPKTAEIDWSIAFSAIVLTCWFELSVSYKNMWALEQK